MPEATDHTSTLRAAYAVVLHVLQIPNHFTARQVLTAVATATLLVIFRLGKPLSTTLRIVLAKVLTLLAVPLAPIVDVALRIKTSAVALAMANEMANEMENSWAV